MNRTALMLVGGSVSLSVIVMTGSAAHAILPPTLSVDGSPQAEAQTMNQPIASEEAPQAVSATDTRIKQLAQATFGCTCANCMNSVRQMIQQGQLSL